MKKRFSILSVGALMLLASALTCVLIFAAARVYNISLEKRSDIAAYLELRDKIDEYYIGEYDESEMQSAMLHGAVDGLGDRWSYYMTPEEYKEYQISSSNQYVGIGVSVRKNEDNGALQVFAVFPGSPSEQAGLKAGDMIVAVDGVDITGMKLDEASDLIEGSLGDEITLSVLDENGNKKDVTMIRELIYSSPVDYELLEDGVGYVSLENFEAGAAEMCISAVEELIDEGAKSLVFDVRNNLGGKLSELTAILDYLLPEGDIFVSITADGEEEVTGSDPECLKMPMAVLVNRYTFSAAEFFAAALDEYDWAITCGESTVGKGRSQITVPMEDGGALHISSREYVTPKRVSLDAQGGYTPKYVVEMDEDNEILLYYHSLPAEDDVQLQKVIEVISGRSN